MATNGAVRTEPFPGKGESAPNVCSISGFKITTQKLPILKAGPIDRMTEKLGIAPPEMIFGDNYVAIEHEATGWSINFNAFDALDLVDKTGEQRLQVAHSSEWKAARCTCLTYCRMQRWLTLVREHHHEEIKEVVKPFDWSYSTDYKGTVSGAPSFEASDKPIPLELLKRPDPIKFFDELVLYEGELDDNGITMLSCKIRVMPERLLLLTRFFMRLDGVLFRIRDTRVFVEFRTGEVIREYIAREEKFETVRHKLAMRGADVPATLRDANRLSDLLPIIDGVNEQLVLIGH